MYGNNYPNDFNNKNVIDGTAKEVKPENGNFSGQNTNGYHTGGYGAKHTNTSSYGSYGGGSYGAGGSYGQSGSGGSWQYEGYRSSYQEPKRPGKAKKEKKPGGFLKKALISVSLGLFFGICAGVGFFAVESATGMLKGNLTQAEAPSAGQAAKGTVEGGASAPTDGNAETLNNTIGDTGEMRAVVTDVTDVVKQVMPAIVSINNTFTQTTSFFGQQMQSESTAAGSGIIVGESDSELLIVSNYHVIESADKLLVQFADGEKAEAQVKGSDASMDLAVIAVSLEDVKTTTRDAIAVATLGDSDSLTVGEPAIAIGNSLGYGQSVTVGVISALDRTINLTSTDGSMSTGDNTFIQTDAAINPGNSGGALLNMNGEVIGINSNKIGGSAVEGMGYAIPISSAKPIIEDLMLRETRSKVKEENKGYLGITPLTVVTEMTEAYGMPKGVYVSAVYENTAAQAAGIKKGNIITEFDGIEITSADDLLETMSYYSAGDTVDVVIMQGNPAGWESKTLSVTLGSKPAE